MTIRQITYCASSRLACSGNLPADVILCIPQEKVAPHVCVEGGDETYGYRHIAASATAFCKTSACASSTVYKYTFEYDDVQLVQDTELLSEHIEGVFCKGCLTSWIEDLVGNEIQVIEEGSTITITSQHGCETSFTISGSGGGISVIDTESINLTLVGDDLSADVNISLTADNQLSIEADGLFVPPPWIPPDDNGTDLGTVLLRWKDLYLGGNAEIGGDANVAGSVNLIVQNQGFNFQTVALDADVTTAIGIPNFLDISLASSSNAAFGIVGYGANANPKAIHFLKTRSAASSDANTIVAAADVLGSIEAWGSDGVNYLKGGMIRFIVSAPPGVNDMPTDIVLYQTKDAASSPIESWRFSQNLTLLSRDDDAAIGTGSADGNDTRSMAIGSGSTLSITRGAYAIFYGNEHATQPGRAIIRGGDVATGSIILIAPNAAGTINFQTGGVVTRWIMEASGAFVGDAAADGFIGVNTTNGTDIRALILSSASAYAIARGAGVALYGNEHANAGSIEIFCGNTATADVTIGAIRNLNLDSQGGAGQIFFKSGGGVTRWQLDAGGTLFSNATNGGDLSIQRLGKTLKIAEGANAKMGVGTLTNGAVTISTTSVTANSRVILTRLVGAGTTRGILTPGTITPATSFDVRAEDLTGTLSADDDSTFSWVLLEPA